MSWTVYLQNFIKLNDIILLGLEFDKLHTLLTWYVLWA